MGLWNGISIGIRKKHIRIGNKFDCVEGVRPIRHRDLSSHNTSNFENWYQESRDCHLSSISNFWSKLLRDFSEDGIIWKCHDRDFPRISSSENLPGIGNTRKMAISRFLVPIFKISSIVAWQISVTNGSKKLVIKCTTEWFCEKMRCRLDLWMRKNSWDAGKNYQINVPQATFLTKSWWVCLIDIVCNSFFTHHSWDFSFLK